MYHRKRLTAALLVSAVTVLLSAPAGVYGAEYTADMPAEEVMAPDIYESEEMSAADAEEPAESPQNGPGAAPEDAAGEVPSPDLSSPVGLSDGSDETFQTEDMPVSEADVCPQEPNADDTETIVKEEGEDSAYDDPVQAEPDHEQDVMETDTSDSSTAITEAEDGDLPAVDGLPKEDKKEVHSEEGTAVDRAKDADVSENSGKETKAPAETAENVASAPRAADPAEENEKTAKDEKSAEPKPADDKAAEIHAGITIEKTEEESAVTASCAGSAAAAAPAPALNGWKTERGKRFYYTNGKKATGIRRIGGKKYVFGSSGALVKNGWVTIGTKRVHTDKKGRLQTGWKTIGGKKYYFSPKTGTMKKGLVKIRGKKYYFTVSGNLRRSGKVQVGKNVYEIGNKGLLTKTGTAKLKKGWKNEEGARFYYVKGKRVTGVKKIKGKRYLFDADGRLAKNTWVTIKGKTYHADKKGRLQTGLTKIGDRYYFFGISGARQSGFKSTGGKKYYFDVKGVRKTGWITVKGKRYYLTPGVATGKRSINGKTYLFDPDGAMRTGKVKDSFGTYYYGPDGALVKGKEVVIGGITYLTDTSGKITTGKKTENGKTFLFDADGNELKDTYADYGGTSYHVDKNGNAKTHTHTWGPVRKKVHHEAEGHTEWMQTGTDWVVVDEPWDEPVYEFMYCCTYWAQGEDPCGFMDQDDDVVAYHVVTVHGRTSYTYSDGSLSFPSWSSGYVQTGTIHHPAGDKKAVERYGEVYVEDIPAWDEEVITGYRCSECGKSK